MKWKKGTKTKVATAPFPSTPPPPLDRICMECVCEQTRLWCQIQRRGLEVRWGAKRGGGSGRRRRHCQQLESRIRLLTLRRVACVIHVAHANSTVPRSAWFIGADVLLCQHWEPQRRCTCLGKAMKGEVLHNALMIFFSFFLFFVFVFKQWRSEAAAFPGSVCRCTSVMWWHQRKW